MTPSEQATVAILNLTGKQNAPADVRADVTRLVDSYYQSKVNMSKPVGFIVEKLGVSFAAYAGEIANALQ